MSIDECSCPIAGFCERHGIQKPEHWHELCRTRDDYRQAWDQGRGPAQSGAHNQPQRPRPPDKDERSRAAWAALHAYTQPGTWNQAEAENWYENTWKPMVPRAGCSCRKHWRELEAANPPDFSSEELFFRWGVERHNDVNELLSKELYSWEDAVSDRQKALKA